MPDKTVIHRFANGRHDYSKAEPVQNGKEKAAGTRPGSATWAVFN